MKLKSILLLRLKKDNQWATDLLNKLTFFFDYFDKSLIVLSVTTGSIFIAPFATVIGPPIGMASASFSLSFSIFTGIVKETVKSNKK